MIWLADITIAGVGVDVHRAMEAARSLEMEGISASVLDLRTVSPLDKAAVCEAVAQTGRLAKIVQPCGRSAISARRWRREGIRPPVVS